MWINGIDLMLPVDGCIPDLTRLHGRVAGEVKQNGTRVAIEVKDELVGVRNRRNVDYGGRLPELEVDARRLPDCAIDGEAVVFRHGRTWRVGSQIRCSTQDRVKIIKGMKKHPIVFMAFDILSLRGVDLRSRPYLERKRILKNLLSPYGTLNSYGPIHTRTATRKEKRTATREIPIRSRISQKGVGEGTGETSKDNGRSGIEEKGEEKMERQFAEKTGIQGSTQRTLLCRRATANERNGFGDVGGQMSDMRDRGFGYSSHTSFDTEKDEGYGSALSNREVIHLLTGGIENTLSTSMCKLSSQEDPRKQTFRCIRYVPFSLDLQGMWDEVVAMGREGLMLKPWDSRYMQGRSSLWKRVKPPQHMVVTVVGYTKGSGKRADTFGSLVLEDGGVYVGKVGTGFDGAVLTKLKRFMGSEGKAVTPKREVYTTCRPFKIRVGYAEITDEGRIFQGSYQGVVDQMRG